jgi:NADPH:quinone reductase-like Zn-dependent oxidoreductase
VKAILLDGFGGPEVLKLGETTAPNAGPGRVLIRVAATSVNRPDVIQRQGHYPPPTGESEILGLEVAGTIEDVGGGVTDFSPGERVFALLGGGGYAELASAYAGHVMKMPPNLSFEQAACICETYITAHMNLFGNAHLQDGETVLLHGGGGGVTTAAMELCRALVPHARVLVTASTAKVARVKALGADAVIDYKSEDFADAVLRLTDGRGADVVFDFVGTDATHATSMDMLANAGTFSVIGYGGTFPVASLMLVSQEQSVVGNLVGSWTDLYELIQLHAAGRLTLRVETHPFESINDVLDKLREGGILGRAVLVPE